MSKLFEFTGGILIYLQKILTLLASHVFFSCLLALGKTQTCFSICLLAQPFLVKIDLNSYRVLFWMEARLLRLGAAIAFQLNRRRCSLVDQSAC